MITFDDTQVNKDLRSLGQKEDEELVVRAAARRGIPSIDLSGTIISTEALALIDETQSRAAGIAAFRVIGKNLHLATLSEQDPRAREIIIGLQQDGYEVVVYLASQRSLEKAWSRYEDLKLSLKTQGSFIDITDESLRAIVSRVHVNTDIEKLFLGISGDEENKRTSQMIEIIMGSAIAMHASDVHIEPQNENVRLRYREDGILEDIFFFDHATYKEINSRIKILSGMKLNITQNAQDGRFTIDYQGVEIEIRVSMTPGAYGEGVVMRILNPSSISVGLEELGIEPYLLEILKEEIAKPNGMILNTGPTGSGKTTTLYSFLKYIYRPEIKILTIEDPIEYHLEGVHQTQVNHKQGYDFESGLRAAMRQDPDVILVGEIRDNETALAAMQASQTGHMVFSTLHTNNAAGAVPRLLDLGINHATLSQSMTVAIAQRLTRKLTPAKKAVAPTPYQENLLRMILRNAEKHGKDLSRFNVSSKMPIQLYEPVPDETSSSGYKGRLGIFEAILIDSHVKDLLDKKPTDRQVKEAAQHQNILTMIEDAAVKLIQGVTSFEEVSRVIDLEEDVKEELRAMEASSNTATAANTGAGFAGVSSYDSTPLSAGVHNSGDILDQVRLNLDHERRPQTSKDTLLAGKELSLLVDYLRMLENHQREYPDVSVAAKIGEVQNTIMNLLKNNQAGDLFVQQDNERLIKKEIELLMQDLEELKQHQLQNPDIGVADKIQSIRAAIEGMTHQMAR